MRRSLLLLICGLGGACSDDADSGPEICTDGIDNDLDGFADCSDSECFADCIEECTNGVDDDHNDLIDCYDPACFGGLCAEICDDGLDNDADGDSDCLDVDCADQCPEICDDGFDNDGDNVLDCDDPDCDSTCDADGDAAVAEAFGGDDCDDTDPNNYPGNVETCDGQDNDCDLLIDDADSAVVAATTWYIDDDLDGYGGSALARCTQPTGTVVQGGDCDDSDASINPDAIEICNFGIDDDCDGLEDDLDPGVDLSTVITWYPDNDLDGWGVPGLTLEQCSQPFGYAANDIDCNDDNPIILGEEPWLLDIDSDGFGAGTPSPPSCTQPAPGYVRESEGLDCDANSPTVYPGAPETCGDGIDQDCDLVDLLCVVDIASTVVRYGAAVVDPLAGTYDGTEGIVFTGNASGTVYCDYVWQAQDWTNSPTAIGPSPIGASCSDPDGNPCDWDFAVVLDGGISVTGDPIDCTTVYGVTPIAPFSPAGYGWITSYVVGGVDLGSAWMYYDVGLPGWLGLNGGSYDAVTGDFSYAALTDTAAPVPP